MAWRDEAEWLDRGVVRAFDYGGVSFQKMLNGAASGAAVPLPGDFSAAFLEVGGGDRVEGASRSPVIRVHFADFPDGVRPAAADRIILASGNGAGTYVIDAAEGNDDLTGALLRLRKATKP